MAASPNASLNLKTIKKLLLDPIKFRETDYQGKACFSYDYKKYGAFETWDLAIEKLGDLPENENVFNELILDDFRVKPYLDIEWIKEDFPAYEIRQIQVDIVKALQDIFLKEWDYSLEDNFIKFARCHRKTNKGYKYSFHVVIATNPTVIFKNANYASYLAKRLRKTIKIYSEEIVDLSVYKKTQNIRLVGHCKSGEYIPFQIENHTDKVSDYIITNVDTNSIVLNVDEQKDHLYRSIRNIKKVEKVDDITQRLTVLHPTCFYEKIDASGFIQMNYSDRSEPCFVGEERYHDKIGFFAYVHDNLIYAGCHSGNCVDENNRKIIKIVGSVDINKNLRFEKVDFDNTFNDIDHSFIEDCIFNGAIGISNLFEKMYLVPKRIKWINDTTLGESYFWDGKLWQQDDYSFIERLLVITVVRVLREFQKVYKKNKENSISLIDPETEEILEISAKIIKRLNDGLMISSILKFVKPLLRDLEFSKIKDVHPYFLSCKNGMINLTTGELRPSVPNDNITKSIQICYDPNADSADFDKFIKQITSTEIGENVDGYNFFKWLIGYALQGSPKKKIFIILFGPHGFNGKSLALNTISDVLEFYAITMDKSVVIDGPGKSAGSHSTEICQLENCRFGILSDTKEDACINDGQIKQLTGITDKLSVREIFGKQKEFIPTFVPFISTNHPIQVNLTDKAMYERLILFPFHLSFIDNPDPKLKWQKKGDNSLSEKFKRNKEGILKWLVDASVYYNDNQDMQVPDMITEAKEMYNKQINYYLDFLDRTFIVINEISIKEKYTIKRIELLELYKEYCHENSQKYISRNAEKEFNKILGSKLIKGAKHYVGLKYKEDINNEDDELGR